MKVKKILYMVIVLASINLSFVSVHAQGIETAEIDILTDAMNEFKINNGVLEKYTGDGGDVVIPKGVTSIGNYAFRYSKLTSVIIPEGVTSIGDDAFYDCSNLVDVTIPKSVTNIGQRAFNGTLWIENERKNDPLVVVNHILIDGTTCIGDVVIPDGVTNIGGGAFNSCSSVTSVTIPEGVMNIGNGAFYVCKNLTDVTFPRSLTDIGFSAFANCNNLTNVTISSNSCLTSIGEHAFDETLWLENERKNNPLVALNNILFDAQTCTGEVIIPEGVTYIEDGAFVDCSELKSVTIPSSVTNIGNTFINCRSLVNVVIPDSVADIGYFAFRECNENLMLSVAGGSYAETYAINHNISCYIDGKGHTIINGIEINNGVLEAYPNDVENLVIPEGVTEIGPGAFKYCRNLKSVVIPKEIMRIDRYAFYGCESLTSVTIAGNISCIEDNAFMNCRSLTNVIISGSIKEIGDFAFYECGKLKNVVFPQGLVSIGDYAFMGCCNLSSMKIPEGMSNLGEYAFKDCSELKNVTIPQSVTIIGENAFSGTLWIKNQRKKNPLLVINHILIDGYACTGDLTIPKGVTSISGHAFDGCKNLRSVVIPKEVTSIGGYAFAGCKNLKSITIPKSLKNIGMHAFIDTMWLDNKREINPFVTVNHILIDGQACTGNIIIPVGVTRIADRAFENCKDIKSIIIPKNVTGIGDGAFMNCRNLESVVIMEGVKSIGRVAFSDSDHLKSVTIAKSVTNIGENLFVDYNKNLKLYVSKGSYAETYAENYVINEGEGIKWKLSYFYIEDHAHSEGSFMASASPKTNGFTEKACVICGQEKNKNIIYAPKTIKLSKASVVFNGKTQKPTVTIKDGKGKTLNSKNDYVVSYQKPMKNVGSYMITVKFKGKYSGVMEKNFDIVPKGTSISKLQAKKGGFTVKWKKQAVQTSGYELAYSLDSKFKKKNTRIISIGKKGTIYKNVSKCKAKKKYYVRVRTYKIVKGEKCYSNWSKAKSVTTKR